MIGRLKSKTGIGLIAIAAIIAAMIVIRQLNPMAKPAFPFLSGGGTLEEEADRPNYVSTRVKDQNRHMEPIKLLLPADEAMSVMKEVISATRGSEIVKADEYYLRAKFRSTVFGFIDDVEMLICLDQDEIHFRSSSRVGHSDLGVNRSRMQKISAAVKAEQKKRAEQPGSL